jgi:transposase
MLFEHEKEYESRWSATVSIAGKISCTPETLRMWRNAKRPILDTATA